MVYHSLKKINDMNSWCVIIFHFIATTHRDKPISTKAMYAFLCECVYECVYLKVKSRLWKLFSGYATSVAFLPSEKWYTYVRRTLVYWKTFWIDTYYYYSWAHTETETETFIYRYFSFVLLIQNIIANYCHSVWLLTFMCECLC